MATQEAVELFTLFSIYTKDATPTVTTAVGHRLAAFATPEAYDGGGAVAIYAYFPEQKGWGYVGLLHGSSQASTNAVRSLGSSMVIAGDTLIIGAKGDDSSPGRVVIAQPPYGVWTYGSLPSLSVLSAPKPTRGDRFGTSVAGCYDGGEWYVAVGAPNTEPPMGPYGRGAAFVYKGLETSNTPFSANWGTNPVDGADATVEFGKAVAIGPGLNEEGEPDGTVVLAVAAPGAAGGQGAVYVGSTTTPGEWPGRWTYSQVIEPKFPDFIDEDFRTAGFGTSLAMAGGVILAVGSPADPNFEKEIEGTGAVWIYNWGDGQFNLVQEGGSIYGDDADAQFGASIAFPTGGEEDNGSVAPPVHLVCAAPGSRHAFLYTTEDGETFTKAAEFSPFAGKPGDGFGQDVDIAIHDSEPWCVVGAPGDAGAGIQGGGYLFAEGEDEMKWLDPPKGFEEPALRWMTANLQNLAAITPEPYNYYR